MKKVCKGCGRNRRIGKFGRLSASSDGKNPYCRDCMRSKTTAYKKSPIGRSIQKKCIEKYEKKNKKTRKEYFKEYYIKNKERILYNKRARETLIFEKEEKSVKPKINKSIEVYIEINPKRKGNDC